MDRVWLPRNTLEYEIGARNFVSEASSSLVIGGMDEKYKRNPCWSNHGDRRDRTSADVPTSEEEAYGGLKFHTPLAGKECFAVSFAASTSGSMNLRRAQIPHTTSRKRMFRLAEDMKKKSTDPSKVTRSKVWIAGHTHTDVRPVKPEFVETIEQIQSIDTQMDSTANDNIKEDVVSQVLGKDKSGRVRGLGRGITATKLGFLHARDTHVQKLEATQADLISQIQDLKNAFNELAGKRKTLIIWEFNLK